MRTEHKREIWIDIAKGLGILLVILGHCDVKPGIVKWTHSVDVPLFFIISGLLYRNGSKSTGYITFIRKKAKTILLPYITLGIINYFLLLIIKLLNHKYTPDMPLTYFLGVCFTISDWLPNCLPLWFLPTFFNSVIIFDGIQRISKKEYQYLAVFLCVATSYILDLINFPHLIWKIDPALMGVGLMQAGKELQRYKEKIHSASWYMVILLFVIGGVLSMLNPAYYDMNENSYGNILLMLPGTLFGTVGLMAFSAKLEKLSETNIVNRIILFFANNTIIIMGFECFVGTILGFAYNIIGVPVNGTTFFIGKLIVLPVVIVCVNWAKGIQKSLLHFSGGANIM